MANRVDETIQRLCKTAHRHDPAGSTDAELLGCFLERRDEAAFGMLVRRHGAMVWGVCRRMLGHHHDAEDAFQATFLVLARRAAAVRPRHMVANWLYGVAQRTALQARRSSRRVRERQVLNMPEPENRRADFWIELAPVLDQELARLPDKYRTVIVLCDLEGKTRKEVARHLSIPEGTLSSRLTTARVILAKRLGRRGLKVSGGALAAALSQQAATASVPALVMAATIKAAPWSAVGKATGKVAALAEGVMNAMRLTKITKATVTVLLCGLLTFTYGALPGATVGGSGTSDSAQQRVEQGQKRTAEIKTGLPRPAPGPEVVLHRTTNFEVQAADDETARAIGKRAEEARKRQALAWLGEAMPDWKVRCRICVEIMPLGPSDSWAMFTSDQPGPLRMELKGSMDAVSQDELPLQIAHAVVYHDLGMATPRWVGAGMGWLDRSEPSRQASMKLCRDLLARERLIPLAKLLPSTAFPDNVSAFYPQSHMLTRFLVGQKGRATFLAFVDLGMRRDWDAAVRRFYGLDGVAVLEIAWRKSLGEDETQGADPFRLPTVEVDPRRPNPPDREIRGVIKSVHSDQTLVQISVGADAGLTKGHTLEVYRVKPQPRYLGQLRIVDVQPSVAIGRLERSAGGNRAQELRVGDQVISQFPRSGPRVDDAP